MKPMSLLGLCLLLVPGCFLVPEEPDTPPPDDCGSPGSLDGIDAIELGSIDPNDAAAGFVPWQENQNVDLTYGLQGGAMVGVVLELHGSDVPGCVRHSMELRGRYGGGVLASTEYPVKTYPESDGTRRTKIIWLIFEDAYPEQGDQLTLALQVGDIEVSQSIVIDAPQPAGMSVIIDGLPVESTALTSGRTYTLNVAFDRWIQSNLTLTIESSDPAVLRPTEPTLQVTPYNAETGITTVIEAVAPGGPVTLRATANGHTAEQVFTVVAPAGAQ